jgi:hypothetical protein
MRSTTSSATSERSGAVSTATPGTTRRRLDRLSAVRHAGAVVAVDRGNVVEHGLHLRVEHLRRVRVSGQVSVEHVEDRGAHLGGGGCLPAPVEDQLVVQVDEQVFLRWP